MKKNCFLGFYSRNITEDNDIRINTVAEYSFSPDKQSVSFIEQDGEFRNCRTTVTVEDHSRVIIERTGRYATYIEAEKNKRLISQHATPFGSYTMGISLREFSSDLDENGGTLTFEYSTDVDFSVVNRIEFTLKIRVKESDADGSDIQNL